MFKDTSKPAAFGGNEVDTLKLFLVLHDKR